jgi:hypothetical protein
MDGFTTTLTGSTVDQALPRNVEPPPDRTADKRAPGRAI